MVFILACFLFLAASVVLLLKRKVHRPYSKTVAMATGLAMLAVVCLAQNYNQSLIPGANDGIGISNRVAYWIIGEDGWSVELFRSMFEWSIYIALLLILIYPLVLLLESRAKSRLSL